MAVFTSSAQYGTLNLGFGQWGGVGPGRVRSVRAWHQVLLGEVGSQTTLENVLSSRISLGYDIRVCEAQFTVPTIDISTQYNTLVEIWQGNGTVNAPRFTGYIKSFDYSLYPQSVTITCKGQLQRAIEYEQTASGPPESNGKTLATLLGASTGTDAEIARAVLTEVGLEFETFDIHGTSTSLGTLDATEFLWRHGQSAMDYLDAIDRISGYRVYEDAPGRLVRGRPSLVPNANIDMAFTVGEDIFAGAHSNLSVLEARNTFVIQGYDAGDGEGPLTYSLTQANDYQPASETHTFSFASPMIQTLNGDINSVSCEGLARYWAAELSREMIKVTLTTPRDDIINPSNTVLVDGLDRLGLSAKMIVQRVDVTVDAQGFRQDLTLVGGGPDGFYTPPDWG